MPVSASIRSRGYLPHWESDGAAYFVTFRLADSLPQSLIAEIRRERALLQRLYVAPASRRRSLLSEADNLRLKKLRLLLKKAEDCLDSGLGRCYMRDPRVAAIVADAIRHFDGHRYRLFAWCVMPNHVHVLFSPLGQSTLAATLQSWKSHSAHLINLALGRSGVLWQREYFDHLVRSESHLLKFADYIRKNPEKAGLKNWPWVSDLFCTAGVSPASSPFASSIPNSRRPESGATKNSA